jgi:ornithine cyclodeaminase
MPGHLRGSALATKVITVCPGNRARNRSLVGGVVVVTDPANGDVLAIMAAGALTGLRTAAASAVAARTLARPDVAVLAVVGAGVQGRAHVRAMAHLYALREVRLCSRRAEMAEAAARELAPRIGADMRVTATPEDAVRDADLVVTATTASDPVVRGSWVAEGAHVCAVGAASPNHRELDTAVLRRASVIATDTREGALAEAGDLMMPIAAGELAADRVVEVGEILRDGAKGRQAPEEVTVFKSVGLAAVDAAVAGALYGAAVRQGVGTAIDLSGGRP